MYVVTKVATADCLRAPRNKIVDFFKKNYGALGTLMPGVHTPLTGVLPPIFTASSSWCFFIGHGLLLLALKIASSTAM